MSVFSLEILATECIVTDLSQQQEEFTPATEEIASTFGVQDDADAHGDSGPIQVTYSKFFYADTRKYHVQSYQALFYC